MLSFSTHYVFYVAFVAYKYLIITHYNLIKITVKKAFVQSYLNHYHITILKHTYYWFMHYA